MRHLPGCDRHLGSIAIAHLPSPKVPSTMKVLLPENTELNGFEYQLQRTLEQANLAGYALMGFAFREAQAGGLHEIDALLLIEPGIFVCLEAKGYSGRWTGSANQRWKSDDHDIKSVSTNPYKQVSNYSHIIKDRLRQEFFQDIEVHVNGFVVAPDQAEIEIQGAVVDQFRVGRAILICHLCRLEAVLTSMFVSGKRQDLIAKMREVGLEQIISTLINVPVAQLNQLVTSSQSQSKSSAVGFSTADHSFQEAYEQKPEPLRIPDVLASAVEREVTQPSEPVESHAKEVVHSVPSTVQAGVVQRSKAVPLKPHPRRNRFNPITIAAGAVLVLVSTGAVAQFFWSNRPCEASTETRINGTCYKNLTRTPLRVGVLATPDRYAEFRAYLKEQLGSKALDVVIEGSADMRYVEAQNKAATQEWDIVFAMSPINGMRAKDNGYTWVARMFPQSPPFYQSALYVRASSPIQSLNDIRTTTKIALGDISSASSFYMPAYDLYGKSMTVSTGHRSSQIKELVASGMADIGVAVYSSIKDDPLFRVIHVSREIPGSGVYVSPKISPTDIDTIRQAMLNAPEEIQNEANYGEGQEPDYELFRMISLRAEEVLSCTNFEQQPVQFFCNQNSPVSAQSEGVTGRIAGFTNQGNGIVSLRFNADSGNVCQLSIALKTLSGIPNGNSPGMINRQQVRITGVKLEDMLGQNCQLMITNPRQLMILNGEPSIPPAKNPPSSTPTN